MKTLVVYFSRKGYTRRIAEETAAQCGGDLLALKTTERTEGILGFWWCGRFGMHRWGMPLVPTGVDVSAYDAVIVCSPVWVFTVCAPVRTFLSENHGRMKAVEYKLVHFSFPMHYGKTVRRMDALAGVHHRRYTSIACQWGLFFRQRVFENASAAAPETTEVTL